VIASFEPSIDYVVTKIPRFAFEVLVYGHHSARMIRLTPDATG
jgi:carbamoylphosphate synthase large subunit